MMASSGFNHFPEIAAAFPQVLGDIVTETARAGEQYIKENIQANGQVKTGFMLDSVYHRTVDESTYGQAGPPPGDAYLLPETDAPLDRTTAQIAVAASYWIYENYGTRYIPARPFFEPGIEHAQQDFNDKLGTVEDRLQGMI